MIAARLVEDLMKRSVVTLAEEHDLLEARKRLGQHSFHHLPVVDGRRLVGLLSQRDVLRATVAVGAFAQAREGHYLEQTFVRDVTRTELETVKPEERVSDAARRMLEHRAGDPKNLLGIITENDLVRLLPEAP